LATGALGDVAKGQVPGAGNLTNSLSGILGKKKQ
jgi:hypothetical protein